MNNTSIVGFKRLLVTARSVFLVFIAGAGIKGPLAFAALEQFALDSSGQLFSYITSAPVGGDVVFHQEFDDINAGTVLSNNQIKAAFAPATAIRNNVSPGATVVADPANSGRGNVFRMFFPKGTYGKYGGGQWTTKIPASDEYYFAYDVYVPVGFKFPLSTKLPGLFGGNMGSAAGNNADMNGVDGFSVFQGMTSEKKAGDTSGWSNIGDGNFGASTFTYAKPQKKRRYNPNLNDDWDGDQARLIPGRWMRLEQHVKLNDATSTVGVGVKANGIYEVWLDGVKVFYADDWIYRQTTALKADGIFFVWWYGGSGSKFAAREDQHIYLDNFVVVSAKPGSSQPAASSSTSRQPAASSSTSTRTRTSTSQPRQRSQRSSSRNRTSTRRRR